MCAHLTSKSCDENVKQRDPIFANLIKLDKSGKKHGRGKKAQALLDDPRSLVDQFSDRLRRFLIGGDSEYPLDYRKVFNSVFDLNHRL